MELELVQTTNQLSGNLAKRSPEAVNRSMNDLLKEPFNLAGLWGRVHSPVQGPCISCLISKVDPMVP